MNAERKPAVRERAVSEMERWARRGLRERPEGSNVVPELVALAVRLRVAPAYRHMGWPWCAFAVFLAALEAGGRAAVLGLREGAFNPLYVPELLARARARECALEVVGRDEARRGDLVLFDWAPDAGDPADHIGRLRAPPAGGAVSSVEGNSGGAVALRARPLASVRAFVRDR